jgi:hypothetical protein
MRAPCSEHIRYVVMNGPCACLSLPCLTTFLLGSRGADVPCCNRMTRSVVVRAYLASNKIEFKYLNRNLMVTKLYPLTLSSTAILIRRTMCLILCALMMAL